MKQGTRGETPSSVKLVARVVGWLLNRLRGASQESPRLAVLERVALAPRQSLVLIEAEGRLLLVATSPESAPAFYPLDEPVRPRRAGPEPVPEMVSRYVSSRKRPSSSRDAGGSW